MSNRSIWDRLYLAVMAVAALAVLLVFRDYGITWDEPLHVEYGRRALDWYLSLGADRDVLTYQNLALYGALYDTAAAGLAELLQADPYDVRRLLGGMVGLLGVAAVRRAGIDLSGPRVGTLAALLLLLTPDWWGHAFNNPKDAPFAVAGAWALVFAIRVAKTLPRPPLPDLAGLGLALGAGMGIRVGGILFAAPLAFAGLAWIAGRLREGGAPAAVARETGRAALVLLAAALLAWMVMVAAWPWAQLDPLSNPLRALSEFSNFPLDFTFTFAGERLRTTALPWWYLPTGFAVKVPLVLLAAVLLAAGMGILSVFRGRFKPPRVALAAAILVPPAIVISTGAVLYDGIRHMLFILPPLSLAAALAINKAAKAVAPERARLGWGLLALGALVHLAGAARLHPYETIWYNALVGGVPGAAGRFELDYWGSAMSEAARDLTETLVRREGASSVVAPHRVSFCGPPDSARYRLPPHWRSVEPDEPADFHIAHTRSACAGAPSGPEIVRVERAGVPLAYVLDLRPSRAP
ncbi:MAG TPA: hypothetical protein VED40_13850 [Azospirillaceae bacterium]|nr:hypothetical protein [Azospirillaceae bacterium]